MKTPLDKAMQLKSKYFDLFFRELENTIADSEAIECTKTDIDNTIETLRGIIEVSESDDVYKELNRAINDLLDVKHELNQM